MFWSPGVKICIHDPKPFYTNGDVVAGVVLLINSKAFSVHEISVKMKCEELASIAFDSTNLDISDISALGSYRRLLLTHKRSLFPPETLRDWKSSENEAQFTLQSGEHRFPFSFEIPPYEAGFPPTIEASIGNYICWSINATVHMTSALDKTRKASYNLNVQASRSSKDLDLKTTRKSTHEKSVNNYKPGYRSLSIFKRLLLARDYRHKVSVRLTSYVLESGIQQGLRPLGLQIGISTEAPLLIRRFECGLLRTYSVALLSPPEFEQEWSQLLLLEHMDQEINEGVQHINEILNRTRIVNLMAPSKNEGVIQTSYELLVTITVASAENKWDEERIQARDPVTLQPLVIDNFTGGPPAYHDFRNLSTDKWSSIFHPTVIDPITNTDPK